MDKLIRATSKSAGYDLPCKDDILIPVGQRLRVDTGITIKLGLGHFGAICSRSGLAAKHGVFVLNAPGIVDEDYEGTLQVILFNSGAEPVRLPAGSRIAQLVVMPYAVLPSDEAADRIRGAGGLGSTGS